MTLVCIDPGLSMGEGGTGWAMFENKLMPEKWGVVKPRRQDGLEWIERSNSIIVQLGSMFDIADMRKRPKALIELPTFFQSLKGSACATGKSGDDSDLVKLAVHVGRLYEFFYHLEWSVEFIRVNEWKGTMSKTAVVERINRRLEKVVDFGDHATDAVGMGLHYKGVFAANAMPKRTPNS
jgi:hypothetical protein